MSNVNTCDLVNDHTPYQVMFWNGEDYCAGFMVGKLLICGCCGGTFELDEVIDMARKSNQIPVRKFQVWVNISNEIRGDETDVMSAIPLFCEEEDN